MKRLVAALIFVLLCSVPAFGDDKALVEFRVGVDPGYPPFNELVGERLRLYAQGSMRDDRFLVPRIRCHSGLLRTTKLASNTGSPDRLDLTT